MLNTGHFEFIRTQIKANERCTSHTVKWYGQMICFSKELFTRIVVQSKTTRADKWNWNQKSVLKKNIPFEKNRWVF